MTRPEFERIAHDLHSQGYCVLKNFLSETECGEAREEILSLRSAGRLQAAKIGKAMLHQSAPEIRKDATAWFDPQALSPIQELIWRRLEEVRTAVNRELYLGLWELEGHYAVYEPGAFYRKHLDRFSNDSRRTLSAVLFFNPSWKETDGGVLRMETGTKTLDVLPEAGVAVFFLSDRIPHEVTETKRERLSFAGWYKTAR